MPGEPLVVHEIHSEQDPLWPQWQAIYRESFPDHERMSEAFFTEKLRAHSTGPARDFHLLAMASPAGEVAGIACYELRRLSRAGVLWYLATRAHQRNRGYGAMLYAEITRRLRSAGASALFLEVEIPEIVAAQGEDRAQWAARRIAWYQRQGALLLTGIHYLQHVDQPFPPVPMHLMVHPLEPLDASRACAMAADLFGSALTQIGPPGLQGQKVP
ncbi:MAG: GNAT family N-acetyltransferase [Chloroherpetonaceae bacterium]|nr:GNAT family N-acetyltransferase [Chthonomonadaceae bacterium]MDW8208161.1 GNAT family N-acetyltransferase [Chloroherpetonaceae bacterium]